MPSPPRMSAFSLSPPRSRCMSSQPRMDDDLSPPRMDDDLSPRRMDDDLSPPCMDDERPPPCMDDERPPCMDDERPPPWPCCANTRAAINATIAAEPSKFFIFIVDFLLCNCALVTALRAEQPARVQPQIEGKAVQIKRHAARIAHFKAHDR